MQGLSASASESYGNLKRTPYHKPGHKQTSDTIKLFFCCDDNEMIIAWNNSITVNLK